MQSNLDKILSSDQEKSKTLPNKFLLNGNAKLSSSFTATSTIMHQATLDNAANGSKRGGDSLFYNISSKSKPVAPKMSVTIGVASGAEALKTINTYNMNNNSVELEKSSAFSPIKNNFFTAGSSTTLENNSSNQNSPQITTSANSSQDERRPSITRIIRSDSFQNVKPMAPIATPRPASNSVSSSTSHLSNTSR